MSGIDVVGGKAARDPATDRVIRQSPHPGSRDAEDAQARRDIGFASAIQTSRALV
jgi:hypothetical protein